MKTSDLMRDIAIYLEGLQAGKGNLSPLGFVHLEQLWRVVKDYQDIESRTAVKAFENLGDSLRKQGFKD